jgi:hypothetical protein
MASGARFIAMVLGIHLAACGAAGLSGGRWFFCGALGFEIPPELALPAGIVLVFLAVGRARRDDAEPL